MSSLKKRVAAYALSQGVDIVIVEGLDFGRSLTASLGSRTILFVDGSVADSREYGEVVYRACEWACGATRAEVKLYKTLRVLMAS